jgi:hypothetical protein
MPYLNPEDKKAYQREYMRNTRAEKKQDRAEKGSKTKMLDPDQLQTAEGLFSVLRRALIEIVNCKADPISKGRAVGYLVNTGFKALELTGFEERLQALEEVISNKGGPKIGE